MAITTEHRTLRSRATNIEARDERARKLFAIPPELTAAEFAALDAACQTDLNALYPLVAGKRALATPVAALTVTERYRIVQCRKLPNGIKRVFVSLAGGVATL